MSLSTFAAVLMLVAAAKAPRPPKPPKPPPKPAAASQPIAFKLQSGELSYKLMHKLHTVVGKCKRLEGMALLLPDQKLQVMLRARVDCFDSGNANRDVHMLEAVEGEKFPTVEYKGISSNVVLPQNGKGSIKTRLNGMLTLHGVALPQVIDVQLSFNAQSQAVVSTKFTVSQDAFKINRPSLMFVKVDDPLTIDASLTLLPGAPP